MNPTTKRIMVLEMKVQQLTEVVNQLKAKDLGSEIQKHIQMYKKKKRRNRKKLCPKLEIPPSSDSESLSSTEKYPENNVITNSSPGLSLSDVAITEKYPPMDIVMKLEVEVNEEREVDVEDVEIYGAAYDEREEEKEDTDEIIHLDYYNPHNPHDLELSVDAGEFSESRVNNITNQVKTVTAPTVKILPYSQGASHPTPDNEEMRTDTGFLAYIERIQNGALFTNNSKCIHCGSVQKCKSRLVAHLRTHYKFCPFTCDFCPEAFKTSSALKVHTAYHTGDGLYTCTFCNKGFISRSSHRTHEMIHRGRKDYKCILCSKEFRTRNHLNRHMRTHTGEKPYTCGVCGKNFSLMENAKVHLRIHEKGSKIVSNLL